MANVREFSEGASQSVWRKSVNVGEILNALGRPASVSELYRRGVSQEQLRWAVRKRLIIRIRTGWYADPQLNPEIIQAVRVGGVLCGPSAAKYYGLWVPHFRGLYVSVSPRSSRLRSPVSNQLSLKDFLRQHPRAIRVFWDAPPYPPEIVAEPLLEALRRIIQMCEPEFSFVVLESALKQRKITEQQLWQLLQTLPKIERSLMLKAAALSDSGTESMLKFALLKLGIPFQQQVSIEGVGRVDFLIDRKLVVEIDSQEFHQHQYRDRKRDQALVHRGYRYLRFVYPQIVYELEQTLATIRLEYQRPR